MSDKKFYTNNSRAPLEVPQDHLNPDEVEPRASSIIEVDFSVAAVAQLRAEKAARAAVRQEVAPQNSGEVGASAINAVRNQGGQYVPTSEAA